MPQLPNGAFGPIPGSVVLDGSGNGQLTFQPNGKNARITNLFGNVSTTTNQAIVNVYLGQVAASNRVFNNNSGSTGFSANGQIDVMDGQTLYVVWTGGDAGATASATFSGTTVPFGEAGFGGGFHMEAGDPIAAGDGSLIFPALKSTNYQTGVAGWRISREGEAEFLQVTVRGVLEVDGDDDSSILVWSIGGQPQIYLTPAQTIPGWFINAALIEATTSTGSETTTLSIVGPTLQGGLGSTPQLNLQSATDTSLAFKSSATLSADEIEITADVDDLILRTNAGDISLAPAGDIRTDAMITFQNGRERYGQGRFTTPYTRATDVVIPTAGNATLVSFGSLTFISGRVYKLCMVAKYGGSGQYPGCFIQVNGAGVFLDFGRINYVGALSKAITIEGYFCVAGGSNVTVTSLTVIAQNAVTATVTQQGATSPVVCEIFDVGSTSIFPNLTSL